MKYGKIIVFFILIFIVSCMKKEEVELTFYNSRPDITNVLVNAFQSFSEKYPNVNINIEDIRKDSQSILDAHFRTGQTRDIVLIPHYSVVKDGAEKGYIADITKFKIINKVPHEIRNGLLYNNRIYGFPVSILTDGVIYNKKIFESNGIAVPRSYGELSNVCEVLYNAGITPFGLPANRRRTGISIFSAALTSLLRDEGMSIAEIRKINLNDVISNPIMLKKISDRIGIIKRYSYEYSHSSKSELDMFLSGEIAMMVQSHNAFLRLVNNHEHIQPGFFPLSFNDKSADNYLSADSDVVLVVREGLDKVKMKYIEKLFSHMAKMEVMSDFLVNARLLSPFKYGRFENSRHDDVLNLTSSYRIDPFIYRGWSGVHLDKVYEITNNIFIEENLE